MRKLFLLSFMIFCVAICSIISESTVTFSKDLPFIILSTPDKTITNNTPRYLGETARFTGTYYDGSTEEINYIPGDGEYLYTSGIVTSSGGHTGTDVRSDPDPSFTQSTYNMSATAGAFQAKIDNYATSINAGSFVNTSSGLGKRFILSGATEPASLSVDMLSQGQIIANKVENTNAIFTHYAGFVPQSERQPDGTLTHEKVIVFDGRRENAPPVIPFGTVPEFTFPADRAYDDIRSNPFSVKPDVPVRLSEIVNADVFEDSYDVPGTSEADVDYFDPEIVNFTYVPNLTELTLDGSVINIDGQQLPLSEFGYTVTAANVPEPCTILLVGAGLAGIGLLRKRFKN